MGEPLKDQLGEPEIRRLAAGFVAAGPFDTEAFVATALDGLDALALKARVAHLASAVRAHLPDDYREALARVLASLPPPSDTTEGLTVGFERWALCHFVEAFGVHDPEASLPALKELTKHFSAEFAIRPFLREDPRATLALFHAWTTDPSPHVRRLVSEGTRPRLPWGMRLRQFQADPSLALPLLERLKDDPEPYVRRSVANHLGDIAKDHPELAAEVGARWLEGASDDRAWVVRHGLRHLLKQGHPGSLALFGYGPLEVAASLTVGPAVLAFPGELVIEACLEHRAPGQRDLRIDLVLDRPTLTAKRSRKVFVWTQRSAAAGEVVALQRRLTLKPISTRRYCPGTHTLELQVNGATVASASFELTM